MLLLAAMVLGALCERFKQSAILGYLLAGALLGSNAAHLVTEEQQVGAIAQIGVVLLMFSIGLEFRLQKLRRLGIRTLLGGGLQVAGTIFVAGLIATIFGLGAEAAFTVGAVVALSSTTIVLPVLAMRGELDSVHGRFALGVLLLQDLAVVPLLLVVQSMVNGGTPTAVIVETGKSFLMVVTYAVVFGLFNRVVLPRLICFGAAARNRDIASLFAIVIAAGSAWIAHQIGFSPALGAFIAGIFLGESVMATQIRSDVAPLKTVFATLFFASIGMYLDLGFITANLPLLLLVMGCVVLGKPLVLWAIGLFVGLPLRYALAAGVCMGQIGVFSFVLAQVALGGPTAQVIDEPLFDLLINVTILTLFLTPTLIRIAVPIGILAERGFCLLVSSQSQTPPPEPPAPAIKGHVIIIGFGPAGRAVAETLRAEEQVFVVIDLNPRTVLEAQASGLSAYVGDAGTSDVFVLAQASRAKAIAITLPDHRTMIAAIHHARALSTARIIVRARYQRYVEDFKMAGAHAVINEEDSVGRDLGRALRELL